MHAAPENIAALAHELWCDHMLDLGWSPGQYDPDARTHDALVPFDRLGKHDRGGASTPTPAATGRGCSALSSPSDPISIWRRRQRTAAAAGIVFTAAAAAWAFWPLPEPAAIDATLREPEDDGRPDTAPASLDREAFAAAVWNPPAPERSDERSPSASAPPPVRLQLIGIAHDTTPGGEDVLRAALYDPDTDKLHIVAAGERVGAVAVIAVEPGVVHLETGGRATELRIRKDGTS